MKPFTFIISTKHNPPAKGNHIPAINAHCASFAHKKKYRKHPSPVLPSKQTAPKSPPPKAVAKKHEEESQKPHSPADQLDTSRSKCSACAQECLSPNLCPHTQDFDAQLYTILDPFSRTPLKLSRREQVLLQEFLTNNKMLVYGTAVGSQQICFTRAYSRANLPWGSKLHLLAHIIMAEAPLRHKHESSSTFYLRRAQIYEAMNQHLSNKKATFRDKVISFLTLSLIETSLSMRDLQEKHVIALHHFIDNNGGMFRAFSELCPANLIDDLPGILIQHLSEHVPIYTISILEETLSLFIQVLKDTAKWASSVYLLESPVVTAALKLQAGECPFPKLRKYLFSLVDYLKREDLDPRVPQGVYHCMFGNLMLHQAVYHYDAPTSLRFLEGLEACLAANNSSITCEVLFSNVFWVQGATSSSLLNSVHSKIGNPVKGKEIRILQGTYASLRAVALLSPPIRAKLAYIIRRCIFAAFRPVRPDILKEKFLHVIAEDIRNTWNTRRGMYDHQQET